VCSSDLALPGGVDKWGPILKSLNLTGG